MLITRSRTRSERAVAAAVTMALVVAGSVALGAGPAVAADEDLRFGVTSEVPLQDYSSTLLQDISTHSLFSFSSSPNLITVVDSDTLAVRTTYPVPGAVDALTLGTEDQRLYVASRSAGTITGVDIFSGAPVYHASVSRPSTIIADDGLDLLWAYSKDNGTITGMDSVDGAAIGDPITIGKNATSFAVDRSTHTLYVTTQFAHELIIIDGHTQQITRRVPLESIPQAVVVDRDTHVAFVAWSSSVARVDPDPEVPLQVFETGVWSDSLVLDPTSDDVMLVDTDNGILAALDPETGVVLRHGDVPTYSRVMFDESGERLFVPNLQERSIAVLTRGTPATITSTELGGKPQHTVPFASPALIADGPGPITWSIVGRTGLGLSIDEHTGIVSGTPTYRGTFAFTVRAGNTFGYDDLLVSITIAEQPKTKPTVGHYRFVMPQIKGASIAGGVDGSTGYPAPTFTATGLPKGVTMNSGGGLDGMPKQVGLFRVRVTAKNSSGSTTKVLPMRILGQDWSTVYVNFGYSRTTLNSENRKELRTLARSIRKTATMQNYDLYGLAPNTKHKSKDLKRAKKRAWAMAKYLRHVGLDWKPTYHYEVERDYSKYHSYGSSTAAVLYTYK